MYSITNSERFTDGWQGEKTCIRCHQIFIANSGMHKICDECKLCQWCGEYIKGKNSSWKKFCNNSCAGKWKYKNSDKVKKAIEYGFKHPNRGIGISRYHKGKPKPYMIGINNPNWRGGTSGERQKVMASIPYRQWRTDVFERDNYTCQICLQRGGDLQADHIKPYALFPELRLDLNNGRTLCKSCHIKTATWGQNVYEYSA